MRLLFFSPTPSHNVVSVKEHILVLCRFFNSVFLYCSSLQLACLKVFYRGIKSHFQEQNLLQNTKGLLVWGLLSRAVNNEDVSAPCSQQCCSVQRRARWQRRLCVLCCRWEAVQVHVGRLRLAVRALRWADAPLPEAHGGQALPVRRLQPQLLPLRPPGAPHEEASELRAALLRDAVLYLCNFLLTLDVQLKLVEFLSISI